MDGDQSEMNPKDKFVFAVGNGGFVLVRESLWVRFANSGKEFFKVFHNSGLAGF